MFWGTQLGWNAKFLLPLIFNKKSPTVRGLTAGQRVSAFFRREDMKNHVLCRYLTLMVRYVKRKNAE
jgi:hypothetical protein